MDKPNVLLIGSVLMSLPVFFSWFADNPHAIEEIITCLSYRTTYAHFTFNVLLSYDS